MNDDSAQPSSVAPFRMTPGVAEKRIKELAAETEHIIWSNHAQDRMSERGITDIQVLEILRVGMVVDAPEKTEHDEWKCKIIKEIRGRRTAGVVTILLHNGRLFLMTVEWEDVK